MRRIVSWIVAAPASSLLVAGLITGAFVTQLPELEVNVSPHLLMVGSDPAVQFYDETRARFGKDELTMIVLKADDVFTTEVLGAVERISDEVQAMPEVARVDSLTTVNDIRAEGDSVDVGRLLAGVDLEDARALAAVRRQALRSPIFVGKILAPDVRTTAVVVYTESDADDLEFSERFTAQIDAIVDAEQKRSGIDIYQVGRPYRQATQARVLISDQKLTLPLGGLLIIVVLALMFRSPSAVVIPVISRIMTIIWAIGVMATLGYPVSMLSGMIPLLMISVGFTEDVHIISEYRNLTARGLGKLEAIRHTMNDLATPLLVTSFTTAVGFAGLGFSRITILSQLGIIASLGFIASFVVTLLVVPALLRFAPAPRLTAPAADDANGSPSSSRLTDWMVALSGRAIRHRRVLFGATAIVLCVCTTAAQRITVDNDILGFFRAGSEIRVRVQDIHENLAGAPIFYIVVDSGHEGGALEPNALEQITGLQEHLADSGEIDSSLSISDFLATIHREMNGGKAEFFTTPDSSALAAQYLILLEPSDIERYIDTDNSAANILIRHNVTSTRRMSALLEDIETYAAQHMRGLDVTATAETILTTRAADELAVSMFKGMGITVVIVAGVCALFFMSLRAAALSLLPNLLPIAVVFGVIGIFGIPINVGTALVAGIAIGIAVDDTIHYMARNSVELDMHHDVMIAMQRTVTSEGRAIVATSLALAAGFLVLTSSSFVPLAYFGVLSAVTMVVALLCDLTLTPALMASTRLVTLWNIVGLKFNGDICESSPLLQGLSRWEARKVVLLGRLVEFADGAVIVRKGESHDHCLYLVLNGEVRVRSEDAGREQQIRVLEPGATFGEMALVEARERSADVVAQSRAELLVLSAEDLKRLERRFPRTALKVLHNLAMILSQRLRDTTDRLLRSARAAA